MLQCQPEEMGHIPYLALHHMTTPLQSPGHMPRHSLSRIAADPGCHGGTSSAMLLVGAPLSTRLSGCSQPCAIGHIHMECYMSAFIRHSWPVSIRPQPQAAGVIGPQATQQRAAALRSLPFPLALPGRLACPRRLASSCASATSTLAFAQPASGSSWQSSEACLP